jgi:hypothetical protein
MSSTDQGRAVSRAQFQTKGHQNSKTVGRVVNADDFALIPMPSIVGKATGRSNWL